jgi:hypothetical protein
MPRKKHRVRKQEADPQIGEICASIIKYKGFKQLAGYNMSCLLQKITPPAAGWEENVKAVVKLDGIATIVDVLKKQKGNAEILATASKTLSKLAINPEFSQMIATNGGIGSALASLEAFPDDMENEDSRQGLEDTVQLLEKVAATAPDALVEGGSVANIIAVMKKHQENTDCVAACSRTLERISRTGPGLTEIVQQNGVPTMLAMFNSDSSDQSCISPGFKLMDRVCRTEQYSKYVSDCGGVETMVKLLEKNQGEHMVLKQGGRLLSKMAKHQLPETLAKLQNSSLPEATKIMTVNLLSNLAMEDTCADQIVQNGGISTLIGDLARSDLSADVIETEVKFLGRLMTSSKNVNEMVANSGVDAVLTVMHNNYSNASIMNGVVPTLVAMCSAAEDIHSIVGSNGASGLDSIITTMSNHPEYIQSTESGIKLIAKLASSDLEDYKAGLIQSGAIVATTRAMAANPDSEITQVNGIKVMAALATEPSYGQYIVDTGVVNSVITGLEQFIDNSNFVGDSFTLLSQLTEESNNGRAATIALLKTSEGFEAITAAIINYGDDAKMQTAVASVLNSIVEKSDVTAAVATFKEAAGKLSKDDDKASSNIRSALEKLTAYSISAVSAPWVLEAGGLDAMISVLKSTAIDNEIPEQEAIISLCTTAINKLLQNSDSRAEVLAKFTDKKLLKSVMTSIKMNPQINSTAAMRLIQTLASEKSIQDLLISCGAAEAVVAITRGNSEDPEAVNAGTNVLLRMATSPENIDQIVRKGAVRLVGKILKDSSKDKAFQGTIAPMLTLLNVIMQDSDARDIAVKQGVKDNIMDLMNEHTVDENIQKLGGQILTACVSQNDVVECARLLSEQAQLKGKVNKSELYANLNVLASVAQGRNNAQSLIELGAAQTLVAMLADTVNWEDEEERLTAINAISKAIGSIASKETLDDSTQAVPWLLHALTITESPVVLQAVTAVATTDQNVSSLIAGNGVESIIGCLQKHPNDQAISSSAFQALAKMAASGESAVDKITQSGGLMICKDFLENQVETATAEQQLEAMKLMGCLVTQESTAAYIDSSGGVEAIFDLIDQELVKEEPDLKIIQSGLTMLANAAGTAAVAQSIAGKGDMRRLLQGFENHKSLTEDAEIMKSLSSFLESVIKHAPESVEIMATNNVATLMMESMSIHSNDHILSKQGAKILQSVISAEQAAGIVRNNMTKVNDLLATLEGTNNPMALGQLESQMQNMSGMMMVEGAVNSEYMNDIMVSMDKTINIAAGKSASSQKSGLIVGSLDTIGKLVQLEGVETNKTQIANAIMCATNGSNGDENVMTAAMNLIENTATNSLSVQALDESGCIKVLGSALKESAANPKLNAAAKASVAKLSKMVIDDPSSLSSNTVASILDAQSGDVQQLTQVLDSMCNSNSAALLETISIAPSESMLVEVQAVKSIAKAAAEGKVQIESVTPAQMEGIVRNMRRAQAAKTAEAQSCKTTGMSASVASELVDNSMDLMEIMASSETQANNLCDNGGIEELVSVLDSKESTGLQKKKAAAVLNNVSKHNNHSMSAKMVQLQVSAKIAAALRDVNDDDFANDALELLQSLTSTCGAEESGLDEDSLKIISVAVENQFAKGGENSVSAQKGAALLDSMSSVYKAESSDAIDQKMQNAAAALVSIENIEEVTAEDGRTYYVDRATNQTSWEAPTAYTAACTKFQKVADLGETHADNMIEVDSTTVAQTVTALDALRTKPTAATSVADALSRLATHEKNAKVIAENGGIRSIVNAMRSNPNLTKLLISCVRLLNQFAKHDHYKKIVASEGGIPLVLHCLNTKPEEEILTKLCLSCLANLAFNSQVNLKSIVDHKGIDSIEKIMQHYVETGPVLELTMVALSNLMHENDPVRVTVGQTCGDEIVEIIRRLTDDASLCKSAMRAIGNLSFCDQNIRYIVGEHATEVVVKAMDIHVNDLELLQLGIDVIGNLASLDFNDDEDEETNDDIHDEVYETIFNEGGPTKILEILKSRKETSLLLSGMDALSNIANDDISVERLLKKGLVQLVLESMSANDWDEELSECTVKLLASISVGEECSESIVEQNGVQLLLTSMESHEDQPEFLISAHIALANIVASVEAKKTVLNLKGIPLIVKQLKDFSDNKELTEKIVETLIRLSADDDCSETMSDEGMFVFCGLIDQWSDHVQEDENEAPMLEIIFALLGHLAFVTNNLRKMVQFDGVKKIVASITRKIDDVEIMNKAVQTLDNIAMANNEYCAIVINEGGKEAIESVLKRYEGEYDENEDAEEVVDACKSAILSMAASKIGTSTANGGSTHKRMVSINSNTGGGSGNNNASEDQKRAEKLKNKLAEYKNTLLGGKVVSVQQERGGKKKMHILCSKDLRTFVFKDLKNNSMGQTLKFDDIRRVQHGSCLKKKTKLKPGEGQFYIECVQAVRSIDGKFLSSLFF